MFSPTFVALCGRHLFRFARSCHDYVLALYISLYATRMYVRLMINFLCDAGSFLLFTASEVMRIVLVDRMDLYTIESNGTIPESVLASIPLKMVRWSLSPLIYIQK